MTPLVVTGGIVAVLLFFYLGVALLVPETLS
ncbi:MAG: potassium-transporting ATPase subunit F [Myxococcales bacterium]|nr:potassium-transporting ATPase subunit F [Myxococcales bacterium]